MLQSEIDEISEAFSDAWDEFFGQPMYYVPLMAGSTVHPIYRESKTKQYDVENKKSFNGTFKVKDIEEKGEMNGRDEKTYAEITFVTKELYDQGILKINSRDQIHFFDRGGEEIKCNIIGHSGKVQLGDNKIFTKLDVVVIPS